VDTSKVAGLERTLSFHRTLTNAQVRAYKVRFSKYRTGKDATEEEVARLQAEVQAATDALTAEPVQAVHYHIYALDFHADKEMWAYPAGTIKYNLF
jgi:hypothetical protein